MKLFISLIFAVNGLTDELGITVSEPQCGPLEPKLPQSLLRGPRPDFEGQDVGINPNKIKPTAPSTTTAGLDFVEMTIAERSAEIETEGCCLNHWKLCPNLCHLSDDLENHFARITNGIMPSFEKYRTRLTTWKDNIAKEFEGKLDYIDDGENQIRDGQNGLEAAEDQFLVALGNHHEGLNKVNEQLKNLKKDFDDLKTELRQLNKQTTAYKDECERIAPCRAVYNCQAGVASGSSCQDIVNSVTNKAAEYSTLPTNGYYLLTSQKQSRSAYCEFMEGANNKNYALETIARKTSGLPSKAEIGFNWEKKDCQTSMEPFYLQSSFVTEMSKASKGISLCIFEVSDSGTETKIQTNVKSGNTDTIIKKMSANSKLVLGNCDKEAVEDSSDYDGGDYDDSSYY